MLAETFSYRVGSVTVGGKSPLILIAGLCVIENERHTSAIARRLKQICRKREIGFIFKASYDKANRTSLDSYRGPGLKKGLEILSRVKADLDIPLLIDFHRPEDAEPVARVADILQIPAFLCRQTDLVLAAARTGRALNVKKGQFLAPGDVAHIIKKIESVSNRQIMITERGTSFGYRYLVNDMKALPVMRGFNYPVIFDATHSTQLPGGEKGASGGQREYVPHLARAAVGAGCDGLFLEVHDRPREALSDAASVLDLNQLNGLLAEVRAIDQIVKT